MASGARKIVAKGQEAIASMSGSALSSSESLPALGVIAERFAMLLPVAARQSSLPLMTADEHSVRTMRYGAAVDELARPSVSAVASAPEFGGQFLIALDGNLARVLLHSMMGGRPSTADTSWKSFTHIDRRISARFLDKLLGALGEAFSPFVKVTPKVETVDAQAPAAAVLPRVTPATVITVSVHVEREAGNVTIVIPRSSLDPVRHALEQAGSGDGGAESGWLAGVRDTASGLPLAVDAVLGGAQVPLREILGWKPGTRIVLPPAGPSSTRLVCSGTTVARGRAGQSAGRRAVLVSGDVIGEEAAEPAMSEENPQ